MLDNSSFGYMHSLWPHATLVDPAPGCHYAVAAAPAVAARQMPSLLSWANF